MKCVYRMARTIKVVNKLKEAAAANTTTNADKTSNFSMPYGDDDVIFEDKSKKTPDMQEIRDTILYKGDDPYQEKVVERPIKGRVWGLGGELVKQREVFFDSQESITLDRLISFLELNQIKDIVEHDLQNYNKNNPQRYAIVGTMYSSHHGWKVCKELAKSFMNLYNLEMEAEQLKSRQEGFKAMKATSAEERGLRNTLRIWNTGINTYGKPSICGAKDDEWLMVFYKQYMIHLFTEDSRNEVDIEAKWIYQSSEEQQAEFEKIHSATKSGKGGFFEPL